MNRRSFIAKAVAGLAAVPFAGRIAQAIDSGYHKPIPTVYGIPKPREPQLWLALGNRASDGSFVELSGNGYERAPVIDGNAQFPEARDEWESFDTGAHSRSEDGPIQWTTTFHKKRTVPRGHCLSWITRTN